jgi:hypothetical protein
MPRGIRKIESESREAVAVMEKPKEVHAPLITEITSRDMFEVEDRKPVTGVFRMQNKKPGERGMIRIGAMRKYKGDHMNPWIFEHGKTYTIPKWMADWLNGGKTNEEDKVKSPRCNILSHNDQWNDLHNKRQLAEPNLHAVYSFTPVPKW